MKARESFFFGMIPVLFPILSDRCRNSVVFFNYCFTDTHLIMRRAFFAYRSVKGVIIRRLAVKCICLQTIYLQGNKLLGRENYSR